MEIISLAYLYSAKFNINERIYQVEKGEVTLQSLLELVFNNLNQNESIADEKDEEIIYKFVDLNKDQNSMVINGAIVKIYDGINSEYDRKKDKVIDKEAPDKADYVSFSFDVRQEVIGFVPKQTFSREAFMKYFKHLVEVCVPEIGDIKVMPITDAYMLEQQFKKMKTLKEIEVLVIPSNDDSNDIAELVDILNTDVKESNAQEMGIRLKGSIREPLLKSSKLVDQLKDVAKKAYANIKAKGRDETGADYEIDSSKDTLLKRPIRNDLKNSVSDIEEQTVEATKLYYRQRGREVIDNERNRDKKG